MGDSLLLFCSSKKLEPKVIITTKNQPADSLSKGFSQKTLQCMTSTKHGLIRNGVVGDIGLFIVKTAALEIVRRYTSAKCPVVWRGLQALQVLCYPPFKWIERWTPFKALVKYMQSLSKPLLVLTIATVFSDQSACTTEKVDSSHDSQAYSESRQETSSQLPTSDSRSCDDEVPESLSTENWFQQLHKELEKLGITLPERLNDDEIHRFYTAANGEFSRLLSSIKKTIHWRQTFTFLSPQELESWSHLVFWHGYDVQLRPCLIIRLGLACSSLRSNNRPIFAKAVVSQVEHGVMHLVNVENPQITVLMDCEGLSPFGFPMQMLRSCALLLQDHYPNRLGYLIIIQLPPVARVITQTLFQVMRPTTQQKFRIVGENYQKVLWEYLQSLPSFLGGKYYCLKCSDQVVTHNMNEEIVLMRPSGCLANNENVPSLASRHLTGNRVNPDSDQIMRIVIISILMMWIFITFALAKQYPDCLSLLKWHSGP